MAIDDHPIEVLRRHFELENASALPFAGAIHTALQTASYVLLQKGLRFIDSITSVDPGQETGK